MTGFLKRLALKISLREHPLGYKKSKRLEYYRKWKARRK